MRSYRISNPALARSLSPSAEKALKVHKEAFSLHNSLSLGRKRTTTTTVPGVASSSFARANNATQSENSTSSSSCENDDTKSLCEDREKRERDGDLSPKPFFLCVVYLGFCLFRVFFYRRCCVGKEEASLKETREERERERE